MHGRVTAIAGRSPFEDPPAQWPGSHLRVTVRECNAGKQEDSERMTILQKTPADYVAALERAATRRTTPLKQGEIVWHVWGSGPPLVLMHGGTGSWLHWVRNIEAFVQDYQVVVPDIPGSGESGDPEKPITAKAIAADIFSGL